MSIHRNYVTSMQARLRNWDVELDILRVRAGVAGVAFRHRIEELAAIRHRAAVSIGRIRFAAETAGTQMHHAMDETWEAMLRALHQASLEVGKRPR